MMNFWCVATFSLHSEVQKVRGHQQCLIFGPTLSRCGKLCSTVQRCAASHSAKAWVPLLTAPQSAYSASPTLLMLQPDLGFFGSYNLVQGREFIQHNVVVDGAKGTFAQAILACSQVTYDVARLYKGIRASAPTGRHVRVP